jgi:hypothetical protein
MLAELVEHVIGIDPDRDWTTKRGPLSDPLCAIGSDMS